MTTCKCKGPALSFSNRDQRVTEPESTLYADQPRRGRARRQDDDVSERLDAIEDALSKLTDRVSAFEGRDQEDQDIPDIHDSFPARGVRNLHSMNLNNRTFWANRSAS